jgi:hypothetical protein
MGITRVITRTKSGDVPLSFAKLQAEPDKKPTAVDTAPVFELRESRSRAWFS